MSPSPPPSENVLDYKERNLNERLISTIGLIAAKTTRTITRCGHLSRSFGTTNYESLRGPNPRNEASLSRRIYPATIRPRKFGNASGRPGWKTGEIVGNDIPRSWGLFPARRKDKAGCLVANCLRRREIGPSVWRVTGIRIMQPGSRRQENVWDTYFSGLWRKLSARLRRSWWIPSLDGLGDEW